jgi:hypothetical protein
MRHATSLIRHITVLTAALVCLIPGPARGQESTPPSQGLTNEPGGVERAVVFMDRRQGNGEFTNGFYVDMFNMIPGAGWISAGPGYRHWYARDRVFVNASAAVSWRAYKTAQAMLEFPKLARSRLTVGSQIRLQDFTQVSFFGEGTDSLQSDRSEYRLKSRDLVAYTTFRPVEWAGIGAAIGLLTPSVLPRAGWFERDRPDTRSVFPSDVVFARPESRFVHSEASVTADTRDFPGHPTRGGLYRAAAANYADRDGVFSFRRYEAEAAQFVPLADSRVVVALRGWIASSDTGEGQVVPFYLQPGLGGHNTLRGYADYRFHDRNLIVFNAEGRIALMAHVDAAMFFDAGNVAARVGDLNLDKRSYGGGFRIHTRSRTFGRLDIARGGEGWRFVIRLTDPLDLSRLSRRTAAVPFVP